MLRDVPVRDVMVTEVLSFTPEDNVRDAMRELVLRDIDGGPVVDGDGRVVGMLSTADLIVEEAQIHLPAVIDLLGGLFELPSSRKRYEADLNKALGATVGEVMTTGVKATLTPDDTFETAATVMHDHSLDRLPVVDDDGVLVGIIARGDIVRAIVLEDHPAPTDDGTTEDSDAGDEG
jgi:CBS domain-containing protein